MAWLLPNHYYPWSTFHSDAWVAVLFAFAALAVFVHSSRPMVWHGLPVMFMVLALVPLLQFAAGMLPFSGQAWLATLYVVGLALALMAGARWESATPGRAADGLFLAITAAAMVSVGLQLRQWAGLAQDFDEVRVWAAEFAADRPSANIGQPNQLATLLIWGLLGCAWAVAREKVRPTLALLIALCLLFGVVLTQSRMAMMVLFAITLSAWWWRRLLPRRVPWVITLLFLYFLAGTFSLQWLNDLLNINQQVRSASFGGSSTQLRIDAYMMFLDALTKQPWTGYGWSRLAVAQLAVAQNHPNMTAFFLHSHNLFLDLMIWCGIPIGAFVSIYLMVWFLRCFSKINNVQDGILLIFVMGIGIHAMVELPLHHAYFLLPTGLIMGMLTQRVGGRVIFRTSHWIITAFLLAVSLLLGAIIQDYLRVDESFRTYRLEMNHVGNLPPGPAPDVLVLNDMSEFISSLRTVVRSDINEAEFERIKQDALSFPTPFNLFNYGKALAFRHKSVEAGQWLRKLEKVHTKDYVEHLKRAWAADSRTQPAIAAVPWPSDRSSSKTP